MKYSVKKIICFATVVPVLFLSACSFVPQKYTSTDVGMGTIVSQTVYVKGDGKEVTRKVQDLVNRFEEEISWRIETSDVSGINHFAGKEAGYAISKELSDDLRKVWQISADSDGAFDVTIAPVVRLWNIDAKATGNEQSDLLPSDAEIKDKLSLTGYEDVRIEDNIVYLPAGYLIDLGAVGKGMACDRILSLLKDEMGSLSATRPISGQVSVHGAVISLGGNILTYGEKPDGSAWKVGVVDPMNPDAYLGMLTLTGTNFVTTSGDYERYVEIDGERYHHIIDPGTGYPADSGIRSVTILSDSGLVGDALSTACFVLGRDKALELAQEYGVEILLVTDTGELVMSDGMQSVFVEK